MKKIMFNDKYGLTQAVLEGRKTMTRRVVPDGTPIGNWSETVEHSRYQVGEKVAIAQSYKELGLAPAMFDQLAGWSNKMFVNSFWMERYGHTIRITDIRLERLRDISSEDCLKEGIEARVTGCHTFYYIHGEEKAYNFPKQAFSALIDKVSGKGTWESNPWVFVYEFELLNS